MKYSISSRPFKDAIYQSLSIVGKTLASPKRLELLDLLSQGSKTVETLAKETTMSIANVSQHLQTLLEARLVRFRKQGTYVIYELVDERVSQFLLAFRNLAEHNLPEIPKIKKEFFQAFDHSEPIGTTELTERLQKGNVKIVDVRPSREYEFGHIPEAVSFPIDELEQHLAELPKDKEIIVYCRGPYCAYAAQAVELLRTQGFAAIRFEGGVQDWREHQKQMQQ
ncbi:ArsR/SmtB family transcription factor [Ferviditalea candida]|uniref:Metalloregulator ArsR/SmtB family transcription factor n=1 Tax=Ferviditalea candida TaxID=3108399 RepID=A0ABU5ZEX1_9BACL|nr:metalloregulator ArsR/SmtB family transcription factor [Paenibacillaceae bacterium T2]